MYTPYDGVSDLATWFWISFWIGVICGCLLWGVFGALLAERKGEPLGKWYVICALTGVFGLSVLACKPRRRHAGRAGIAPVPEDVGVTHDEVSLLSTDLRYKQDDGPADRQRIVARIEMTNYGASPVPYNARHFVLVSMSDQQRYVASRLLQDGQPFCGVMQPAETVCGDLVFHAPADDKGYALRWEPRASVSVGVPFFFGSSDTETTSPCARPGVAY
jgi:hypothetical protein